MILIKVTSVFDVRGPIGHCASPVALPLYPPLGLFAMFWACHRRLCDRPQAAMRSGIAHFLAPGNEISRCNNLQASRHLKLLKNCLKSVE